MFPRNNVAVVFVLSYQSIADELYASHDKSVDATAVSAAYQNVCQGILQGIKAAGFSHLSLATSDKINLTMNPMARYYIYFFFLHTNKLHMFFFIRLLWSYFWFLFHFYSGISGS